MSNDDAPIADFGKKSRQTPVNPFRLIKQHKLPVLPPQKVAVYNDDSDENEKKDEQANLFMQERNRLLDTAKTTRKRARDDAPSLFPPSPSLQNVKLQRELDGEGSRGKRPSKRQKTNMDFFSALTKNDTNNTNNNDTGSRDVEPQDFDAIVNGENLSLLFRRGGENENDG